MAPKKGVKVGLSDFLGDAAKVRLLPSKSDGLDFAKGAGKGGYGGGFGDRDDVGFGGKGKGKRDERSRADDGDWFQKDAPGGRSGFGGGGFGGGGKGKDVPPSRGDGDDQWRGGGGGGFGGGGKGMRDSRFGGGKPDDRDWGRGSGPSERKPLNLKPRSSVAGSDAADSIRAQMSGDKSSAGGPTKGYVPPQLRKQQQERDARQRQEQEDKARQQKLDDQKRREQEEAEEQEQREEQERQKAAEAKKQKEQEQKRLRKKQKDEEKRAVREAAGLRFNAEDEPSEEEMRLHEFEAKVEAAVGAKGDTKKLAKELTQVLEAEDLQTPMPAKYLFRPILNASRGQVDDFVVNLVQRFVPVIEQLIVEAEDVWRYKMKFLAQVATVAAEMKLPRLSPKSALLEVVFDGLYQTELFEEQYFKMWSVWDDDTNPSKTLAVFQVQPFLEFLENGRIDGEDYDDDQEFKVLEGTFAYGDDIEEAVMTMEQAKRRAFELGDICQGFVFEGEYSEEDMFEVVFMSKDGWELTTEDAAEYTTVTKVTGEDSDSESGGDD